MQVKYATKNDNDKNIIIKNNKLYIVREETKNEHK